MYRRTLIIATLAAALMSTSALAQTERTAAAWPTRPVRILVGFPAGSSPDLAARLLAGPLAKALHQSVIVENKPGAGGNIAAAQLAKATDDHTIGMLINGNMTIAKLLNPAMPFDPLTDITPVSLVGTAPLVLVASTSIPGPDSAFLKLARESGDKWSYGSPGIGTVAHIGMELLKSRAGIHPVHVPYAGNPQVITAIMAGQVQMALLPPALAMAQVRAGKMRAIGVTSAERSPLAPELPSLASIGLKDFNLEIWDAVAAPKSMPKELVAKLSTLIADIVHTPAMREKLIQQGWTPVGSTPEELSARVKSDTAQLGGVITKLGIRAE